jgi:hypothetical protein
MAEIMARHYSALIAKFCTKIRIIMFVKVFFCAIVLSGCYKNKRYTLNEFLVLQNVVGVDVSNVVHSTIQPSLNSDYRNSDYFAKLSLSDEQYRLFLSTNAFRRENVLSLPCGSQSWPKVPKWWNISEHDQKERFSRRVGDAIIIVVRKDNSTYLFGSD